MNECSDKKTLAVNDRQLATILAALRFHQAENLQGAVGIPDRAIEEIATDAGELAALDFDEVEELCQRLNTDEVGRHPTDDQDKSELAAIQRVHDVLYLDSDGCQDSDKEWDADTVSAIADIVGQCIPRPTSDLKTDCP